MFFLHSRLKNYARQKILKSHAVLNMVGSLVENVVCSLLETIVLGSVSYVVKHTISPWRWMDVIVVDIGFNIVYILYVMATVRANLHHILHPGCRKIARKILGLDLRDPWGFLKLKYTILTIGMGGVLMVLHIVEDPIATAWIVCVETLAIQLGVDTWQLHGENIHDYVVTNLEPRPKITIFTPPNSPKTPKEEEDEKTPKILNVDVDDSCFTL